MPIFISYSHADRDFVDQLAERLVFAKHHVWMDRWELSLGDSLTSRIQETLTESSAILVILSKSSVDSEWCKRELNAGLVRELEERHTIVMPVVIDDCKIPLFLKDKLYADFRKQPDAAFEMIDRSLSRISNPATARVESPDFNTDFAIDWRKRPVRENEIPWLFRFTFLDAGPQLPYSVLSECQIFATNDNQRRNFLVCVADDKVFDFIGGVAKELVAMADAHGLIVKIEDQFEVAIGGEITVPESGKFTVVFNYRRMGTDTGMDTVVYLENNLRMAYRHIEATLKRPSHPSN
ncbi:toll/interleukin-1 receptor domain-containing protein [Devosia sp. SL43]|uniref:toll/interleukin-1 receptor domain-containing protein n=1 Tax=Devosia sp. SL43 TaxID=2806348 RepID=UPI001F1C4F72|nr:toll/interleukin-1 receptor domain-containing protein [Devosia sp. SL43]UJW86906.1 toll/interleukin-1 receptor domain-containing protein [Devosia sp. SL43]